jgi:hypothetical protein
VNESTITGLAFVLGIVTVLLVRSREVSLWIATVVGLFGFLIALTPFGYVIYWILGGLAGHVR